MTTSATAEQPRLVTTHEVARRLGVSRSTVYRLMETGELPSVRVGGSRRLSSRVIDQYIEAAERGYDRGRWN